MAGPLQASVIMARCSKTKKSYGIRIEKRGGDWVRTWAFPIDERKAKREKFDANTVTGSMEAVDDYPGCPYCGDPGFVHCGCEKIGCAGGVRDYGDYGEYICPWCGEEIQVQHGDSFDIESQGY